MKRGVGAAVAAGFSAVTTGRQKSSVRIIPTILANTMADFTTRMNRLLPVANELQVDFMDGRFVPSTGIPLEEIPDLTRYPGKTFEAHLMVEDPENWIEGLIAKGFNRFIIHYEAVPEMDLLLLIDMLHKDGKQVLLAINPETDVRRVLPYTRQVDGILFLGVHPGFNGAPYVTSTPSRIAEFIALNKHPTSVQVDGGMTPETIGAVVAAGATAINSGSFVGNAPDPSSAMAALRKAANARNGNDDKVHSMGLSIKRTRKIMLLKKKNAPRTARKPTRIAGSKSAVGRAPTTKTRKIRTIKKTRKIKSTRSTRRMSIKRPIVKRSTKRSTKRSAKRLVSKRR